VETAISWAEEPEVKENALKIIENIEDIKSGDGSATLIIEDPFGHSIILHDDAKHRKLTQEEVENLNTGFVTIDQ
jgi:zinc finger protein